MISENLALIRQKISKACSESGREVGSVKLIAVSKNNPVSAILEAHIAGAVFFGENKAQELREKSEIIKQNVIWHFIGHLQTNKVKYVAGCAGVIHSVESEKLAEAIDKRAEAEGIVQKFLIEVNTAEEESKFGITKFEDLKKLADYCNNLQNIQLAGLMTMAPYTDDENVIRNCFGKAREWKDRLNDEGYSLTELSMGMSNDFEIAIKEGSTMVRIGSLIFGERDYSKNWKDE